MRHLAHQTSSSITKCSNEDHIILQQGRQIAQCNRGKSPDRNPYFKTWNLAENAFWITGGKLPKHEWSSLFGHSYGEK